MSVKNRIKIFADYNQINISQFERAIGVSNGYVNSISKSIGLDKIEIILEKYPNLSIEWLITGRGEMLINTQSLKSPNCMLCFEKDKVINAQKETIALLKEKVENLNFRLQKNEGENFGHVSIAAEPKLKYKHTKK